MAQKSHLSRILDSGVTAVIRAKSSEHLIDVAKAIRDGGVECIEVTMTTPNALKVIEQAANEFGDEVLIGVGSVLDAETCRAAILSGAEFVVGPCLDLGVIEMCRTYSKPCIPGAMTPTEILTAWRAGADLVKVFPAGGLGPNYFKDVLAPLPQVKLVPTGGVDVSTAADFIKAGAAALCVGSAMTPKDAMAEGRWDVLTDLASQFVAEVQKARADLDG
ncbi:MAG TPA: bifunctional 4-hydroxy-2-oxoglutarate aldolase/2-dehydro-3-deoxy-phosphogluconate aldolase [Armatimonadota bacterium]|nr:bifunctional 4-hydroxy-2-oxoglutarate aldolase/2-dehydro-3-deoxy-phosphogluconate aldolase [Armatimonadota bacterium]